MRKEVDVTEIEKMEEAKKAYFAAGGKVTKCRDGSAKGIDRYPTILARSKKCMSYNTTSAPKMRLMNYESAFNTPTTYNGSKMVMGNY